MYLYPECFNQQTAIKSQKQELHRLQKYNNANGILLLIKSHDTFEILN